MAQKPVQLDLFETKTAKEVTDEPLTVSHINKEKIPSINDLFQAYANMLAEEAVHLPQQVPRPGYDYPVLSSGVYDPNLFRDLVYGDFSTDPTVTVLGYPLRSTYVPQEQTINVELKYPIKNLQGTYSVELDEPEKTAPKQTRLERVLDEDLIRESEDD